MSGWNEPSRSPRPANYDDMVRIYRGIVQDLKAQGNADPTNEDILKENARRTRAAKGN